MCDNYQNFIENAIKNVEYHCTNFNEAKKCVFDAESQLVIALKAGDEKGVTVAQDICRAAIDEALVALTNTKTSLCSESFRKECFNHAE